MEITEEEAGILGELRPPRLEDAGLEDCALPPDAIKEAFLKAASAVRSRAASILTTDNDTGTFKDDDCVNDPFPSAGDSSDTLVGISPEHDLLNGPCAGEKCGGGLPEVIGDEAGADVTDAEEKIDQVVVGTEVKEEGKACVDGLQGLKIGERNGDGRKKLENDDEEEEDDDKPILVEGYV